MKEWQVTTIFVLAIFLGYFIPALFIRSWCGWIGMLIVYVIDMGISRIKWPDKMNTPEITDSEKMTYTGMAWAIIFMVIELFEIARGPVLFTIYITAAALIYFAWKQHFLD